LTIGVQFWVTYSPVKQAEQFLHAMLPGTFWYLPLLHVVQLLKLL